MFSSVDFLVFLAEVSHPRSVSPKFLFYRELSPFEQVWSTGQLPALTCIVCPLPMFQAIAL